MPLIETKKRLQSTQDSKKITQALQLVAASKMKSFQKKALGSRNYALDLLKALNSILPHSENLSYSEERENGKIIFVLVTSNKGLCGTLNIKLINHLFKSKKWIETPKQDRLLITIGKKGYDSAKRQGIKVELNFDGLNENPTALESLDIVQKIMHFWEDGTAKEIHITSSHYINAFTSLPQTKQYLPFSESMIKSHELENANHLPIPEFERQMLEPSPELLLKKLSLQIIQSLFNQSFFELKASEYSSRMVAMKKSTDAASDLILALTLEYNKIRQSIITQQLAELAVASEAMEEEEEEEDDDDDDDAPDLKKK